MGVSGALNFTNADHGELARLVPEKLDAIAESSTALVDRAAQLAQQISRLAADEMLLVSRACLTLASCATPAALFAAQQGLSFAWLARMMSGAETLGTLAVRSHDDIVAPFHRATAANAARLNGG